MIKKCVKYGLISGLIALLLINNCFASEVRFSLDTSKKLYSEYIWMKETINKNKNVKFQLKKKITLQERQLKVNKQIIKNYNEQLTKLKENFKLKEDQSLEWERSYLKCNKDLIKSNQKAFYEKWYFNFILGILAGAYVSK